MPSSYHSLHCVLPPQVSPLPGIAPPRLGILSSSYHPPPRPPRIVPLPGTSPSPRLDIRPHTGYPPLKHQPPMGQAPPLLSVPCICTHVPQSQGTRLHTHAAQLWCSHAPQTHACGQPVTLPPCVPMHFVLQVQHSHASHTCAHRHSTHQAGGLQWFPQAWLHAPYMADKNLSRFPHTCTRTQHTHAGMHTRCNASHTCAHGHSAQHTQACTHPVTLPTHVHTDTAHITHSHACTVMLPTHMHTDTVHITHRHEPILMLSMCVPTDTACIAHRPARILSHFPHVCTQVHHTPP